MARWRQVAIEKVPQFKERAERSSTPMDLWIELNLQFVMAYDDPKNQEAIDSIYDFAFWCLDSKNEDASTAAWVSFLEHVPSFAIAHKRRHYQAVVADLARHLDRARFDTLQSAFRYFLDDAQFQGFRSDVQLQMDQIDKQRKKKSRVAAAKS